MFVGACARIEMFMQANELKYWVAFTRIPSVGRARFKILEQHFGTLEQAWHVGLSELRAAGLDSRTAHTIATRKLAIDPDAEISELSDLGVEAVTWHDPGYPPRLKEIYDLPPVLFVRGALLPEDERSIAVVGTRRATPYGREVAYQLAHDLAATGVTVVSGLARGIDGIAHRAALETGGRTIAVVANGVDVIYPREHAKLADEMVMNGAIVSEHPLGTRPQAENFPRRNRIMSGMTLGTLVVEAGEGSGALITARHALEQNREVFAVPGSVFSPGSRGTNRLIKESGAKLVSECGDILEELNLSWIGQQLDMVAMFPEEGIESDVLRCVTFDPIHIDEVIRSSGLDIAGVSSALAMMELKGLVRQVGGMNYVRVRETSTSYLSVK